MTTDCNVRISAVMIVKDEERHLPRCLGSLDGVVDEIVVVDTGSQDRTRELAAGWTDRLFTFPWNDDFAEARNSALAQASGDYVLAMDADESIANRDEASILLRRFVRDHESQVVGTIAICSPLGPGAQAARAIFRAQRFFHRASFRYSGAIHEQLIAMSGEKRIAATGVRIHHTGYAQDPAAPDHKSHRNKRLLLKELERHPGDEYAWFQLGRAHMALNEHGDACAAFERAFACMAFDEHGNARGRLGMVAPDVLTDLAASLAYAYVNSGRLDDAVAHVERRQGLAGLGPDFHHARGYVHLAKGDPMRAQEAYREALRSGPEHEHVCGTGSFASLYHLGLIREAEGDLIGGLNYYHQSLSSYPAYPPAIARCIDLIVERRLVLPEAIWDVCDHERFQAMFLEKMRSALDRGEIEEAELMTIAAGAISPALAEQCAALRRV